MGVVIDNLEFKRPHLILQPPITYRMGDIGHGKLTVNENKVISLEVVKDVVPSEIHMDDVRYVAISERSLTPVEIQNILLEYKKYIVSHKEFWESSHGGNMNDAGFRDNYESTKEIAFFSGIKFNIYIVYPKCDTFINYKQWLELVRQKGKIYTAKACLYNTDEYRRYYSETEIQENLDKMRDASIDGLVQQKHHPILHGLYFYYIDESESASIYINHKKYLADKKKKIVKKKSTSVSKGITPFHSVSYIASRIGNKIAEGLRKKYPIWRKYTLCMTQTKANLHYYLEFAKEQGITVDPSEFKNLLPYVPGILKAKEKNDYYKFVKLSIEMKLIEEPKEI